MTWADLISDFIATGGTSNITEDVAAKVAAFFPYYKEIKDSNSDIQISFSSNQLQL